MYKHITFDFTEIAPGLDNPLADLVEGVKEYTVECNFETISGERVISPEPSLLTDDLITHIGVCGSLRGEMYKAMLYEVNTRYSMLVDDGGDIHGDY